MLNELVQMEPAEALEPELAGQFAAIGIVKGEKFEPDARMRKILENAVAFGNAASRTLGLGAHPADHFRYYDKSSAWWNFLFVGGYAFLNPPPLITKEGIKPFPNRGARKLHSRTSMFYTATGITPAMCMRLTGVGSQYLLANVDTNGEPFDGSKTYKVVLPKDIPAARFWSLTVYDNQTRSMLQTPQRRRMPTAQRPFTLVLNGLQVPRKETGSNRTQLKAGSLYCVYTVRYSPSSIRPGGRVRLSW